MNTVQNVMGQMRINAWLALTITCLMTVLVFLGSVRTTNERINKEFNVKIVTPLAKLATGPLKTTALRVID